MFDRLKRRAGKNFGRKWATEGRNPLDGVFLIGKVGEQIRAFLAR